MYQCNYDGKSFQDRFVPACNISWSLIIAAALKFSSYSEFTNSKLYSEILEYCMHKKHNGKGYAETQCQNLIHPHFIYREQRVARNQKIHLEIADLEQRIKDLKGQL